MKKFLIAGLPILPILGLWIFVDQNRSRFPNPVASHWGASGLADGFSDLNTHLTWTIAALCVIGALWSILALIRTPRAIKVLFLGIIGYTFLILYFLMLQTFVAQLDAVDARQVSLGPEFLLFLVPIFLLIPAMLTKPRVVLSDSLRVYLLGIPFLKVGFGEIASAAEGSVSAKDFGGWGIRFANQTTAFVPSSGKALDIALTDSSRILIRSDDAADLATQIEQRKKQ